jgi:hypothetical protein
VYPDSVLREYLGFLYGWPGAGKVLDRYPHDFVLVKRGTGAYRIVDADPRWKKVYQDPVAVLFARTPVAPNEVAGTADGSGAVSSQFP